MGSEAKQRLPCVVNQYSKTLWTDCRPLRNKDIILVEIETPVMLKVVLLTFGKHALGTVDVCMLEDNTWS